MPAPRGGRRLRSETMAPGMAAVGGMGMRRKRWIGMGLMMGAESPVGRR